MRHLAAALAFLLACTSAAFAQDIRDFGSRSARVDRAQRGRPLTPASAAGPAQVVRDFVRTRHGDPVAQTLVVERENLTPRGVTHVQMQQQVAGLPVYGAYIKATVSAAGELLSSIDQLVPVPALTPARVNETDALRAVLVRRYPGVAMPAIARVDGNTTVFASSARFPDPPTASRIAVPLNNGALHQGYLVVTWDRDNVLRHTVVGADGRILFEELRTNNDSYKVFVNSPTRTPQATVSGPFGGNVESPAGWLSSASTKTTIGNNVDAYLDSDSNNAADTGGRPSGGTTGDFLFTANLTSAPTVNANQMVGVTNLFYTNNRIHDILYRHGFTEAAGNFQTDNFGKGGAGNDPLNAEAQDGGGTNNANFATPDDGTRPRMQMYLWTASDPYRDGDVDSDIVFHEYGHGLTWRMIGGMQGPLAGAIGEGMSDVVALYVNNDDAVAEYSYNRPTGIRRARYTDYPNTYGDVTGSSVHDDGEIYAAAMWKLRSLWMDSGRTEDALFDYVVDGMNFTPSRPAYEDMRDGILAAIGSTNPDTQCVVWRAFAAYGIGEGAQGTERCIGAVCLGVTITESFDVPAACAGTTPGNTAPAVTITSPANNSSFSQNSTITFTGTATDTEDGNLGGAIVWTSNVSGPIGTGATVSTKLAVGTHTITATVQDSGGLTSSAAITITVKKKGGKR